MATGASGLTLALVLPPVEKGNSEELVYVTTLLHQTAAATASCQMEVVN